MAGVNLLLSDHRSPGQTAPCVAIGPVNVSFVDQGRRRLPSAPGGIEGAEADRTLTALSVGWARSSVTKRTSGVKPHVSIRLTPTPPRCSPAENGCPLPGRLGMRRFLRITPRPAGLSAPC